MNKLKSIWTSLIGSVSSLFPLFFACCKSGACVGVCASPVASLFGISTATIASSPILNAIEPILIALSAVSFTISYYSLYVLPKLNACKTDCDCAPTSEQTKKEKVSKRIFWIGLVASIVFFTYFEIQKYQAHSAEATSIKTECCPSPAQSSIKESLQLQSTSDTSKACCAEGESCE
ncbi:MAG: hypothetical protein IPJ31_13215 [Bacteroidetes bacterium]|nr:hypothetical protein [Bacteroidota bacterium]